MTTPRNTCLVVILLALVPVAAQGDAEMGERKAQLCLTCHKAANPELPYTPRLQGQTREYLYSQIKAFKDGRRRSDTPMQMNVAPLSDKDMRDVADYFASQPPIRASFQVDSRLSAIGEAKAGQLQCAKCHMADYSGNKEVPRLAGMHPKYTALQILAYGAAKRSHPPVEGMDAISNDEAEGLAQYFGQLP